jgi:hypothetical protein
MLLLAHLLLGIGGSALYICELIPGLPTGRYPIIMFRGPGWPRLLPFLSRCRVDIGKSRNSGLQARLHLTDFLDFARANPNQLLKVLKLDRITG